MRIKLFISNQCRFRPILFGPFNKKASDDGKAYSSKLLSIVDKYLANKTWLVGQRITFADIILGSAIQRGADVVSHILILYNSCSAHVTKVYR